MWTSVLVKMVTSEMAKVLIGLLVKKLLDHKRDGVTKDVAEAMLDGIARSRANKLHVSVVEDMKAML